MRSLKLFPLLILILLFILIGEVFAQTTYVVQPGDTLAAISRRTGVSIEELAAANNIVNPNLIYAGQTLIIPDGSELPAPPPEATAVPPPAPDPDPGPGGTYVVQFGDTLSRIAVVHGVSILSLVQANNLANPNLIYAGQTLIIPGGQPPTTDPPAETTPPPAPPPAPPSQTPTPAPVPPPQPPPPSSVNLLPNPSFENGHYNVNGNPELQVPNGWQLEYDEGGPAPETGLPFFKPETRVLSKAFLPQREHALFVYDGDWTVKGFKAHAPISFRLFTDIHLEPGAYQFSSSYFPDIIIGYDNGKVFDTRASAGEVAFILTNGGSGWTPVTTGTKNTMTQNFTIGSPGTVRVGVAFRTRYAVPNNGYFTDDWSLYRTGN